MTWAVIGATAEIALMVVVLARARKGSLVARTLLLALSGASTLAYLTWRFSSTLIFSSLWGLPALLLVFAELEGFLQTCIFYVLSARPFRRPRPVLPPEDALPDVDLFVPTFNEPAHVLRRTLAACSQVVYPSGRLSVWVLDDGGRAEIREMAEAFGLRYLARTEHAHAKAGNLNNALTQSSGELVAVLDADMVPKSHMLLDMVGYFGEDPRLAFVQAPQAFFNPDPFQHNLGLHRMIPNEQDFFMRNILASRDRVNAVMCVGSNVLFRRTALEAVGGFGTKSITEDMETGMLLHAAGWHSAYHDGEVAVGLAPESMTEMVSQRVRWCRGNIQATRAYKPLTLRGLTPWQRVVYTTGSLYWYFGVQRTIYLVAPLLYLLLGIQSLDATPTTLVAFWLPATVGASMAAAVCSGYSTSFWSSVTELALTPALTIAALRETLRLRGNGFRVTRKGLASQHTTISSHWFTYLGVLLGLELTGVAVGLVKLLTPLGDGVTVALAINLFWATANGLLIILAMLSWVDQARPRNAERFEIATPVSVGFGDDARYGHTVDLSETGARIVLAGTGSRPAWAGPGAACSLRLPGTALELPARVKSWAETPSGNELAVAFDAIADAEFLELVRLLFDRPEVTGRADYRVGLVGAMHRVVRWTTRREGGQRSGRRKRGHVRLRRHPAPGS